MAVTVTRVVNSRVCLGNASLYVDAKSGVNAYGRVEQASTNPKSSNKLMPSVRGLTDSASKSQTPYGASEK